MEIISPNIITTEPAPMYEHMLKRFEALEAELKTIKEQNEELKMALCSAETVHHIGIRVFKLRNSVETQEAVMQNIDQHYDTELKKIWEFIAIASDTTNKNMIALVNKVNNQEHEIANLTNKVFTQEQSIANMQEMLAETTIGIDERITKLEMLVDMHHSELLDTKIGVNMAHDKIDATLKDHKTHINQYVTQFDEGIDAMEEDIERLEQMVKDHEDTLDEHLSTMNTLNEKQADMEQAIKDVDIRHFNAVDHHRLSDRITYLARKLNVKYPGDDGEDLSYLFLDEDDEDDPQRCYNCSRGMSVWTTIDGRRFCEQCITAGINDPYRVRGARREHAPDVEAEHNTAMERYSELISARQVPTWQLTPCVIDEVVDERAQLINIPVPAPQIQDIPALETDDDDPCMSCMVDTCCGTCDNCPNCDMGHDEEETITNYDELERRFRELTTKPRSY